MANRLTRSLLLLPLLAVFLTAGSASSDASPPTATAGPATASGTLLRPNVGLYPRLLRLRHSGSANGTIVASVVTFDGNNGQGAIYSSGDNGRTFSQVGTVADPASADGKGL